MPDAADKVQEAVASNARLVELSDGLLPPLPCAKALSVGGANANGFLRALRDRCRTLVVEFADADGCWDTESLKVRDENLKEAVERGLWWNMLDKKWEDIWPMLPACVHRDG